MVHSPWIKVLPSFQTKSRVKTRWRQPMSWNPWDVFERRPTKYEQNLYQNIDVYFVIWVVSLLVAIPKKNLVNSEGEAWQILPSLGHHNSHPGEGELSGARALKPRAIGTNKSHGGGEKQRWLWLLLLMIFCGIPREKKTIKNNQPCLKWISFNYDFNDFCSMNFIWLIPHLYVCFLVKPPFF